MVTLHIGEKAEQEGRVTIKVLLQRGKGGKERAQRSAAIPNTHEVYLSCHQPKL